jgi:predicted alpha/beta-hydrolase family hydrolase
MARRAATPPAAALVYPGAGGGRDHRTLVALEAALDPFPVVRDEFPRQRAGKKGTDRAPVAVAAVREAAAAVAAERGIDPDRLVLGGRSFGGRMCSMAVAEGLPAAGLALLSYPLHPPGKPEDLRVEHFGRIAVPVLFVSGANDPFARPEELAAHAEAIAGPVSIVTVGGAHDPRRDAEVVAAVRAWLATLGAPVPDG